MCDQWTKPEMDEKIEVRYAALHYTHYVTPQYITSPRWTRRSRYIPVPVPFQFHSNSSSIPFHSILFHFSSIPIPFQFHSNSSSIPVPFHSIPFQFQFQFEFHLHSCSCIPLHFIPFHFIAFHSVPRPGGALGERHLARAHAHRLGRRLPPRRPDQGTGVAAMTHPRCHGMTSPPPPCPGDDRCTTSCASRRTTRRRCCSC